MFPFDDVIMIIVFLLRLENRLHKVFMKVGKVITVTNVNYNEQISRGTI